jgi:hypothetical protein
MFGVKISITGDEIVNVVTPSYLTQAANLLPTIPARYIYSTIISIFKVR